MTITGPIVFEYKHSSVWFDNCCRFGPSMGIFEFGVMADLSEVNTCKNKVNFEVLTAVGTGCRTA